MGNINFKNNKGQFIVPPLFDPKTAVPYHCPDYRSITAICETEPDIIKKFLEPTPFEYVDNKFTVGITDMSNCNKGGFLEAIVIIQARYKDIIGGFILFEYESDDWALSVGRELWGYPKKMADKINYYENRNLISGSAIVNGRELISVEIDLSKKVERELPQVSTTPHLLIHTVPTPDGKGVISKRILSRDTSPDMKIRSITTGEANVTLRGDWLNPVHELLPLKTLGGTFVIADFHATEENGWAKTLEIIK